MKQVCCAELFADLHRLLAAKHAAAMLLERAKQRTNPPDARRAYITTTPENLSLLLSYAKKDEQYYFAKLAVLSYRCSSPLVQNINVC